MVKNQINGAFSSSGEKYNFIAKGKRNNST